MNNRGDWKEQIARAIGAQVVEALIIALIVMVLVLLAV